MLHMQEEDLGTPGLRGDSELHGPALQTFPALFQDLTLQHLEMELKALTLNIKRLAFYYTVKGP